MTQRTAMGRSAVARTAVTTTLAAAVLLTGCGGPDGDSDGDGPATAGAAAGSAEPLTGKQARSVLPDAAAMPGLEPRAEPAIVPMDGDAGQDICPKTHRKGCDGARFRGTAAFTDPATGTEVDFWLIAYDDERSAENGYDILWDWFGRGVGVQPDKVSIGAVGQERTARRGSPDGRTGPVTVAQIRVGATLLWLSTTAGDTAKSTTANSDTAKTGSAMSSTAADTPTTVTDDRLKALATLLAERAQQAERGRAPSAHFAG
ncbi:hypothetical protein [Streptomyces sp. NPDC002187]|uniref:hypothetical protein n=1 Tax=Streptomyces sp. NPDC002187 TaxID=3364637 RepID=UPI003689BD90